MMTIVRIDAEARWSDVVITTTRSTTLVYRKTSTPMPLSKP